MTVFIHLLIVFLWSPGDGVGMEKMRGVCWVGGDSIAIYNFNDLHASNVEWISQTPFGYQKAFDRPEILFDDTGWYWGERREGILHTAMLAREAGIRTILKPHLWMPVRDGKWRSDIAMTSDEGWEQWFCNYTDLAMHFAAIAEESGADVFCIGTELYHASTGFPGKWREMISQVREVYHGEITYAANFFREFEEIEWWDAVDYIGIQGYFPLSEKPSPSIAELREGWHGPLETMKSLSEQFDRPVLLTEIGYRNDTLAAVEPWLWPSQVWDRVTPNDDFQARCYEAFFQECWDEPWLAGAFFWKWHHSTWRFQDRAGYRAQRQIHVDSIRAASGKSRGYWRGDIVFSPQDKPAEIILRNYFSR